eukprot:jgi/Botrbrau1/6062/Bobra.177_1s0002.1
MLWALLFVGIGPLIATAQTQPSLNANTTSLTTSYVDYADNGVGLKGYLAYDNRSTAKRPAVIILPAWEGVGDYVKWRADLLANLGYVGFVADIYTTNYTQPVEDQALRGQLTGMYSGDPALYRSRILAALNHVRTLPQVEPSQLAAIGYCFGGSGVLEAARAWPDPGTQGLKGVMAFHAGGLQSKGSNFSAGLPIFVSVQNGYNDPGVSRAAVAGLASELEAANATWEITEYGNTVHSFTNPLTGRVNNVHGVRAAYTPSSDLRSWWALRGFLLQVFGTLTENATEPYTGDAFDYSANFVVAS